MASPTAYEESQQPEAGDGERTSLKKLVKLMARNSTISPNTIAEVTAQTHATGTNWVQLPSSLGFRLRCDNNTATSLVFKRGNTGNARVTVASGATVDLPLVANANEWYIKRSDDSNTQVTFYGLVWRNV